MRVLPAGNYQRLGDDEVARRPDTRALSRRQALAAAAGFLVAGVTTGGAVAALKTPADEDPVVAMIMEREALIKARPGFHENKQPLFDQALATPATTPRGVIAKARMAMIGDDELIFDGWEKRDYTAAEALREIERQVAKPPVFAPGRGL